MSRVHRYISTPNQSGSSCQRGLLRDQDVPADYVEYRAGRNDAAFGKLGINRSMRFHVVTSCEGRKPVVVVDTVRDKSRATDTDGSAGKWAAGRIGRRCSAKAANNAFTALEILVVLILVNVIS